MSHDGTDKGTVASPSPDDDTVPRCECGAVVIQGGPIVPSFEFISTVGACSRGPNWTWCETAGRLQAWRQK